MSVREGQGLPAPVARSVTFAASRGLGAFKQGLTVLGRHLSAASVHRLILLVNYVALGRWMHERGFDTSHRVAGREEVFEAIRSRLDDQSITYLEFGVYRGASLAYWSKALIQPDAELHAFDSFEGLPEAFDLFGEYRKGRFDVKGQLPGIKDDRITYHKGWFEDTLPPFIVPDSPQLVVTLDADLYSSTILVLKLLAAHIKPGAILYFDDMSRPEHEPKAFGEFMDEFGFSFETVAVDRSLNAAAFRCTTSGHRSGSAR